MTLPVVPRYEPGGAPADVRLALHLVAEGLRYCVAKTDPTRALAGPPAARVAALLSGVPGQLARGSNPVGLAPGRSALIQFVRALPDTIRTADDALLIEWADDALREAGTHLQRLRQNLADDL